MKKLIVVILSLILLVSCKPTYLTMPTGKVVTEKKFKRVTKKSIRKTLRQMTKEEQNSLKGLKFEVVIDTIAK
jgi:hypothetical protein